MAHARSRLGAVMVLVAVALALVGIPPEPAAAAPTDEEGATGTLREQLDAASKGFVVAQATLTKSKTRQKELTTQLATVERDLVVKTATLGELASVAYQRGRLGPVSALLNSSSPEGFVDRAAALETLAATEDKKLRDLLEAKQEVARAKLAIDGEILEQQKQVQIMAARKKQAENALAAAGAGQSSSGPSSGGGSSATAAQGPSGSGGCSIKDPTGTGGCVTPRTAHALQQAKNAGFTRYVYCWRPGSSGEHPKGRACDFAVASSGSFGTTASGGARTYGDNLANYFIKNASRLGVLYVIWFREIWLPSSGWRAYSGSGSPSAEHTDHVHLSVT
jgi:hypothetical protein